MDVKRVFVLGAGSSIGHSNGLFPSILNFFGSAKKLKLHRTEGFSQIANYALKILGKDISTQGQNIDIEAFLTHIEIEIERNPSPELLSIRNEFLSFIQRLLIGLSEQISNKKGEYNQLVEKLSKSDTIITYNWDLLLDNFLGREEVLGSIYGKSPKKDITNPHYNNFVNNFTAIGEGTWGGVSVKKPYDHWDTDNGYFIKAHGSIDWFYCSNEACRAYRKVFPVFDPDHDQHCSECHEQLDCLIIPPVLNKGYRNYPLIRVLWNLAAKEISFANEIVVWGYSLPPTDFYTSWLLRQAREAPLERLTIINPSVISKTKSKITLSITFIRKFFDILRGKLPKESIKLYESFSDYYSDRDIYKTHPILKPLETYRNL